MVALIELLNCSSYESFSFVLFDHAIAADGEPKMSRSLEWHEVTRLRPVSKWGRPLGGTALMLDGTSSGISDTKRGRRGLSRSEER